MTKCMPYQEGEIDSPFSLRNQGANCVQILMQTDPRFLCFLQKYKLFMLSLDEHKKASS